MSILRVALFPFCDVCIRTNRCRIVSFARLRGENLCKTHFNKAKDREHAQLISH
jgi:hypothetical protein